MDRRSFLQMAAAVAAGSAGDVTELELSDQQDRLLALADRENSERWAYETAGNLGHIDSRMFYSEIDAVCDAPDGRVETHAIGLDGIPLDVSVSTNEDDEIGCLVNLTAEQAEAIAVDLLEQAHALRKESDQ